MKIEKSRYEKWKVYDCQTLIRDGKGKCMQNGRRTDHRHRQTYTCIKTVNPNRETSAEQWGQCNAHNWQSVNKVQRHGQEIVPGIVLFSPIYVFSKPTRRIEQKSCMKTCMGKSLWRRNCKLHTSRDVRWIETWSDALQEEKLKINNSLQYTGSEHSCAHRHAWILAPRHRSLGYSSNKWWP